MSRSTPSAPTLGSGGMSLGSGNMLGGMQVGPRQAVVQPGSLSPHSLRPPPPVPPLPPVPPPPPPSPLPMPLWLQPQPGVAPPTARTATATTSHHSARFMDAHLTEATGAAEGAPD